MCSKRAGFTLIELAIVLVLVGILLGLGTSLIGLLIKQAKRKETKERVDAAVASIIGYAQSNSYIPDNSTFSSVVRTPRDAYGKDLRYIYYANLAGSSGYCGAKSSPLKVRLCHDAGCSSYDEIDDVAFIVLSGGENYNVQTFIPSPPGVTTNSTVNVYDPGIEVDDYPSDMNRVEEYDDVVKWVTVSELQQKAGCKPLRITSPHSLPSAIEDTTYSYKLQAEGGRIPYTWSASIGYGLNINSSTGEISGTVNVNNSTTTGELNSCNETISFTATVTDSIGNTDSSSFSILVSPKPLRIVTDYLPYGYEGSKYSATIYAEGGVPSYNWSMSGSCPSGLSCSGNTITGTPSSGSAGTYEITVTVSDACGHSYSRKYTLTINPAAGGNGTGGGGGGGTNCKSFKVYNKSGITLYWGCNCRRRCIWWRNGVRTLYSGQVVIRKRYWWWICSVDGVISFGQAASADKDGDCEVNYYGLGNLGDR